MHCRLRYVESFEFNPTAGVMATQVYRANSAYDPDYTGGGHQPLGFDQYATLYAHYTVLSSHITCTLEPTTTAAVTTPHIMSFGIFLSSSLAPVNPDWNHLMEQPSCRSTLVCNDYHIERLPKVSNSYSASSFFSVKDPNAARGDIGAAVTTNPTDCAYFIVFVQDCSESQDLPVMVGVCEMVFIVEFSEPEEIVQS